MLLLIDNYDSFTFNLYHYLSSLNVKVEVHRNDKIDEKKILNFGSGHGGISYLFHAANHIIYNYDFGSTKKIFSRRRF